LSINPFLLARAAFISDIGDIYGGLIRLYIACFEVLSVMSGILEVSDMFPSILHPCRELLQQRQALWY
jgi:hypothetical protein